MSTQSPLGKTVNVLVYLLQVLLAAVFIGAAAAKFKGDIDIVNMFGGPGRSQWLRYGIGAIEVLCALMLLGPTRSAFAAAVLSTFMLFATLLGMSWVGSSVLLWSSWAAGGIPLAPNILLAACLLVVWVRRGQFSGLAFMQP